MNYRTTLAMVVILLLAVGIGFVYTTSRARRPPTNVPPRQEQFYLVDIDDIRKLEVTYQGKTEKFFMGDDKIWYFDTPEKPKVNMDRWGGITLLVSGPRFERVIADNATDLVRYGLEKPVLTIKAALYNLGLVTIRIGDKTPDGQNVYVLFQDERAVHLIAADWGDVLGRLVTEPPLVTPTPEGGKPEPVDTF